MRFRIHFTWPAGDKGSFEIDPGTLEEFAKLSWGGVFARGGSEPWFETIDPYKPKPASD